MSEIEHVDEFLLELQPRHVPQGPAVYLVRDITSRVLLGYLWLCIGAAGASLVLLWVGR